MFHTHIHLNKMENDLFLSIHNCKFLNHRKVKFVNDGYRYNGLMAKVDFESYCDTTFEHGGKSFSKYPNNVIIGVYTDKFSKSKPEGLYTVMGSAIVNCIRETTYGFIDVTILNSRLTHFL